MHYSEALRRPGQSSGPGFMDLLRESELDRAEDFRRLGLTSLAEAAEARAAEFGADAGGDVDESLRDLFEGFGLNEEEAKYAASGVRRPWERSERSVSDAPDEQERARGNRALEASVKAYARAYGVSESAARDTMEIRVRERFTGRPLAEVTAFLEAYTARLTAEAPTGSGTLSGSRSMTHFNEVLQETRKRPEVTGR